MLLKNLNYKLNLVKNEDFGNISYSLQFDIEIPFPTGGDYCQRTLMKFIEVEKEIMWHP